MRSSASLVGSQPTKSVRNANGDVDHSFLTSIVDPQGILRVQYLGVRFDPEEFRRDLLRLAKEQCHDQTSRISASFLATISSILSTDLSVVS